MSNNKRQRGGWGVVRYLPVLGSPKNEDHFMDRNHPSFSDPKASLVRRASNSNPISRPDTEPAR
jgi:hypothetical protein